MNAFSRSWEITKLSFGVMKEDKELFLFPILGGIFSILFIAAMIFPALVSLIVGETLSVGGIMMYVTIFAIYFGLAFIATFFNTCVVYTTKKRFSGGNATFGESIKFSMSKLHLVVSWSLISATVGLILNILYEASERLGFVGEIIAKIILSILGAAWAMLAAFVIPGMVYHDIGPIDALKKSGHAIKKTWGESLIRYYGLGLIEFLLILAGVIGTVALAFVTLSVSPMVAYAIIALGILYLIAVVASFSVANTVFSTALYVYAETGKVPKGFSSNVLHNAYHKKEK